jgi:UDPglucose 6-dehydrogenase
VKVAVIGTGYVGLVAGACLAETGNEVICVDIDPKRIDELNNGKIPIFEPGLEDYVKRNVQKGRFTFTTDTKRAVEKSLVVFLAVPTPQDEDGSADLQHVLSAARDVAAGINEYKVIVDKSTVPVGTAALVRKVISENTDQPFDVVSNPEFLKEGAAIDDFMKPDRVVIGANSPKAAAIMQDLYSAFVRTGNPIITMRIESAELTKYAANAMLATKISFMNEMSRLCEKVGANVNEVRAGIGSDSRIGKHFLFPGLGFGGSCFPKDLQALAHTGREKGVDLLVVNATIEANRRQKQLLPAKIKARFGENLSGKTFAVWGLAFKANTDDLRESPALTLIDELLAAGASVKAYDPQGMENAEKRYGSRVTFATSEFGTLSGADALIVATEWNEFRHVDFDKIKQALRQPIIFDGRNLYQPDLVREKGFEYYGIGNG